MKKRNCRMLSALTALVMCAGTIGASAQGNAVGIAEYSVGGKQVAAPMPGELTTQVDILSSSNDARLITALYDSRTGELAKAEFSSNTPEGETASTTLNIDTLDGYTLRQFVWEADGMKPISAVQEFGLALKAKCSYGRVVLEWNVLSPELDAASYSVYRDGVRIASGISAERAAYQMNTNDDNSTYMVTAMDVGGKIIAASNSVAPKEELAGVYRFDTENMRHIKNVTAIKSKTYGSDDEQVVAGGAGTLYYDAESDSYKFKETLGDGNWGVDTIGGRTAMFTTLFQQGGNNKNGVINFMLGNAFTTDNKSLTISVDYFDEGTDSFMLRYVNSSAGPNGTKSVKRTNTNTWKTAVFELTDAYFNGAEASGLYDGTADFRFESGGKMLHISNVTVDRGDWFNTAAFDLASSTDGRLDNDTITKQSDSQLQFAGSQTLVKLDEPLENGVMYETPASSDSAFMVTEMDGRQALMAARMKRNVTEASRLYTDGFLYFLLGNKFKSSDKNITISIDYYDNSTSPIGVYYVNAAVDGVSKFGDKRINRTNTNTWKTAEFVLNDAYFNGAENTGLLNQKADFRIIGSGGAPIYVSGVRVSIADKLAYNVKSENADELYPDGVSLTITEDGYTANGMSFIDNKNPLVYSNGDGYSVYETIDGRAAVSTTSFGYGGSTGNNLNRNTYLYFTIDDAYLYGHRDDYAELEIEYFDSCENEIVVEINSSDRPYDRRHVCMMTGTNTWKTTKMIFNNAAFANGQNFGADLRFCTSAKDSSNQLKIGKVSLKNISHKQAAELTNEPKLYIASDSIAANYAEGSEVIGWGMKLPAMIDSAVEVVNYAAPGSSTKTFASFNKIKNSLKKGDYVLICFGHNDSMTDARGTTLDEYKANMKKYITSVFESMATPVVISPVPTYDNGTMADGIDAYRAAAREVALEMNAAFVDLDSAMKSVLESLTVDEALEYYVYENSDRRVHLSDKGAQLAAELIVNGINENDKIRVLKDYINK